MVKYINDAISLSNINKNYYFNIKMKHEKMKGEIEKYSHRLVNQNSRKSKQNPRKLNMIYYFMPDLMFAL